MPGVPRTAYSLGQRERQSHWKRVSAECELARAHGVWKGIPCKFILPVEHATLNLWVPIRDDVLAYFRSRGVAWHDEESRDYGPRASPGPSPHLLDSQVCAINFWWGLARSASALAAVLRTVFADLEEVVAVQTGEPPMPPEWIGLRNYLGESGWMRRGAHATSADFLVVFVDADGARHGVLIESKYSESYEPDAWKRVSPRGTNRADIYRGEFELPDGPFRSDVDIVIEDLLIEPFDQHLRQQLLARAMERASESNLKTVTCLHVAPRGNEAFHRGVTAPKLAARGGTVGDAWRSILRIPTRYRSVAYEDLFSRALALCDSTLDAWCAYQSARYPWKDS
jgi:hypothetical protein